MQEIALLFAKVAEWQTRRFQVPVIAISCGFNSHLSHHRRKRHFCLFSLFKKSENYALAFVFASRDQTQLSFHFKLVATCCNEANSKKIVFLMTALRSACGLCPRQDDGACFSLFTKMLSHLL